MFGQVDYKMEFEKCAIMAGLRRSGHILYAYSYARYLSIMPNICFIYYYVLP